MVSAGQWGLSNGENSMSYVQLTAWLVGLGLGYGLALVYLAQVLGFEGNVHSRVAAALRMIAEEPS